MIRKSQRTSGQHVDSGWGWNPYRGKIPWLLWISTFSSDSEKSIETGCGLDLNCAKDCCYMKIHCVYGKDHCVWRSHCLCGRTTVVYEDTTVCVVKDYSVGTYHCGCGKDHCVWGYHCVCDKDYSVGTYHIYHCGCGKDHCVWRWVPYLSGKTSDSGQEPWVDTWK